MFFFSEILKSILSDKKHLAALVQQRFDINIFELKMGFCFDDEKIISALEKYKDKEWKRKKNWYPDYRKLDKNKAIYYCQKENIDWTFCSSNKYTILLIICLIIILISAAINFIISNSSILYVISLLIIALPFLSYCYSGFTKIYNDSKSLCNIKKYANKIEVIIEQGCTVEETMIENLQWMIFYYRQNKCLIPDWFDKIFYKRIEVHELNKAKIHRNKDKMNKK